MAEAAATIAIDLITGWWKSQALHAATSLGIFEAVDQTSFRSADDMATDLKVDSSFLYRLLRSLASFGLLEEDPSKKFRVTAVGALFRSSHPSSLCQMVLLEAGPVHTAAWRHIPELIRTGKGTSFEREFARPYWDYLKNDPDFAHVFSEAMSSYSANEAPAIRKALGNELLGSSVLCDVGGSYGALLDEILRDWPDAQGIVLDLPEVVAAAPCSKGTTERAGRIEFIGGDMFKNVPIADVYFLKHILHDWSDAACVNVLSVVRRSAKLTSRLFLCEFIAPGPHEPHFAKLFDLHMMATTESKQRTFNEIKALLAQAGWRGEGLLPIDSSPISILEATLL